MVKAIGVLIILGSVVNSLMAQTREQKQLELDRLAKESADYNAMQRARAEKFSRDNNVPLSYRDDKGNLILLVGVSDSGVPLYEATHNAGAAITTGVNKLRENGGLGLNLQGEGITIGVWDGGLVKSHAEFDTRVLTTQGSTPDNHATHVTGTIIAKGVNAAAKGMAPKAKVMSWDFDNDEPEMLSQARPDQTSILLSNHSYGLVAGWRFDAGSWQWLGDAGISNREDFKFGYYSNGARLWDEIAFNAPYYTICKSAGNDRTDAGSGGFPADCNEGSGFDCLSDIANSKNIIVVGAVRKVPDYTGPASVQMSSFSSWGPTDDGRIKPDIVAAGVDIFSTSGVGENLYTVLSGTSMSSPSVTGSLSLLQELYSKLNAGNYMKSATLRALAIHTAKESGADPGPDYMHGWGLLDDEAAAKILLGQDGQNIIVKEETLANHDVYELELNPKPGTKITATVVWTDPAGVPATPSLDPVKLMLVNDLDMRIVDEANNNVFPWILNPANPNAAAQKGDNFRDNVEKIEFSNPEPRKYFLRITHKGELKNLAQNFSLIISYTSTSDPRTAYYWIGDSGNWNVASNWSLTSGGTAAASVPGVNNRVIFDENSFAGTNNVVTLSSDVACSSFTWLTNKEAELLLNGSTLTVQGDFRTSSSTLTANTTGKIRFTGSVNDENTVVITDNDLSDVAFEFDGATRWNMEGSGKVRSIQLAGGYLDMRGIDLEVNELNTTSTDSKVLDVQNATITNLVKSSLDMTGMEMESNGAHIETSPDAPVQINWNNVWYKGRLIIRSPSFTLEGTTRYANVELANDVSITGNNTIDTLTVNAGTDISLTSGSILHLTKETTFNGSDVSRITVASTDGGGNASVMFEGHFKVCFDNVDITNVDQTGDAVVNVDSGSTITNSLNWRQGACDDVLFANFDVSYPCVGSLIEFNTLSEGAIETYSWDFGDPDTEEDKSNDASPRFVYLTEGIYNVTVTVSNSAQSDVYSKLVEVGSNNLPENQIVLSNNKLFSVKSATAYEWYRNDEMIAGAVERIFDYSGEEGVYFVLTKNEQCNRKSSPYIITANEESLERQTISIYPNPANDFFTVKVQERSMVSPWTIRVLDSFGKVLMNEVIVEPEIDISTMNWSRGLYIVIVDSEKGEFFSKLIVNK